MPPSPAKKHKSFNERGNNELTKDVLRAVDGLSSLSSNSRNRETIYSPKSKSIPQSVQQDPHYVLQNITQICHESAKDKANIDVSIQIQSP